MALVKCRECGNEVATTAKTCPKCGAPVPQRKNLLIGCASIVAVLAVLAAIVSATKKPDVAADTSGAGSTGPQSTPAPAATTPPIAVMAKQLHDDYEANEVSADAKYKGKLLAVGGVVSSIDKDAFDNVVLKIMWPGANTFGLEDIMATLKDSEKAKAMQLTKGQPVVVRCQGNGMIMKSPMLDDCAVFANKK